MSNPPGPDNAYLGEHVARLCDSYERLLGRPLIAASDRGRTIFEADFAVLSSDLQNDPIFNYANRCALELFELDWDTLLSLPARQSAEPDLQSARERLMSMVRETGFIEDYSGVRVSSSGRRFRIEQATVWNVVDANGDLHGQAATFARWRFL